MGPFTLLDMTGIDVCAHVTDFLYKEYGLRFEPNPLLKLMMDKKFLGQKSGAGFYMHPAGQVPKKDEPKQVNPELAALIEEAKAQKPSAKAPRDFDVNRIILPMFNEALYAIQEKVAEPFDVDVAMQWGCGLNRGLISLAEEKGLEWCLGQLETEQVIHGERFRPAWILQKLVRGQIHDFKVLNPEPVAAL